MRYRLLSLTVVCLLFAPFCGAGAAWAPELEVLRGEVWRWHEGIKVAAAPADVLRNNERISAAHGEARLVLPYAGRLLLRNNSDLLIASISTDQLDMVSLRLQLERGEVCIDLSGNRFLRGFVTVVGELTRIETGNGTFCAQQQQDQSSVQLLAGSISIQHAVDQSTVMLSEPGTRYSLWKDGSSRLQAADFGTDLQALTAGKFDFAITEPQSMRQDQPALANIAVQVNQADSAAEESQAADGPLVTGEERTVDAVSETGAAAQADEIESAATDAPLSGTPVPADIAAVNIDMVDRGLLAESEPLVAEAPDSTDSKISQTGTEPDKDRYTVYLFSTRRAKDAMRLNRRLQRAGISSEVREKLAGGAKRYRVAVAGFADRQAAQKFSDSIKGQYGITDTWIAERRN